MRHAWLKADDFLSLQCDELLLGSHVLIWLLLKEDLLQDIEETEWIKLEEVAQELLICQESDDVVNVAAPFKWAKRARWELLALHEETHDPEEFVADISATVLNIQFDLSILDVDFLLFDLLGVISTDSLIDMSVERMRLKDWRSLTLHVVG